MGKTYSIKKVGVGGGSSGTLKKKIECWSLFQIPPPLGGSTVNLHINSAGVCLKSGLDGATRTRELEI